jgi:phosphoribosylformimino-5-aminoimidazole carboxamide ribotide isomerase
VIIPAVDVLGGRVVRLRLGAFDQVTVYSEDPVATALEWQRQGAPLVHLVDLEGARTGRPSFSLWRDMAEAGVRFQVGGGIRSPETSLQALEAGAERVVVGTAAVWHPEMLPEFGPIDRLVAAVDVRGGRATGAGWLDEGRDLDRVLDSLAEVGVTRLLVTGIGRDGTMEGPDLELTARVVDDGRFSVIGSGGVGSLDDVATLAGIGCEAVVVGRALYEGRFTLAQALGISSGAE